MCFLNKTTVFHLLQIIHFLITSFLIRIVGVFILLLSLEIDVISTVSRYIMNSLLIRKTFGF